MDRADIKEKLLLLGITAGVFLPIRIIFSAYVSEHWLGSLGIVSAFAILFVYLVKKNKLGKLGEIFERQTRKTLGGKTGKYIIALSIFFLVYFGATLYFIERGDTIYFEDKEIFYLAILNEDGYNIEDMSSYDLIGPKLIAYADSDSFQSIAKFDYMFSIAYAVMNDMSDGWLSHIIIIMFVEQIEVLGLLIFFRHTYKPVKKITTS